MTKQILEISACSRDCNEIRAVDGCEVTYLSDLVHGYVPAGLLIGAGDYLRLKIDVDTGTIIGWNPSVVKARLAQYITQSTLEDELE